MFTQPCKGITEIGITRHDVHRHARFARAKAGRQKIPAAPAFVGVVIGSLSNDAWSPHLG
ncbi:MAG: hypothetical protein ACJASZ_001994 [Yoonia sp.]|jgi:hypothetical protein